MPSPSTPRLPHGAVKSTLADYADGVLGWNRAMLARAITLFESNLPDHHEMAQELLNPAEWMWSLVDEQIRERLQQTDAIRRVAEDAERDVRKGALSPMLGAQAIVRVLRSSGTSGWSRAEEPASCAKAVG
jgi:putative protein kinase ArgK-like GTPase of G3E family